MEGVALNNLKDKKLLILGGSKISCEIVNKAKEKGIYTLVTDWYPVEDSPAKQIADEYFMTSTSDIDAMVKLIKEQQVDGVLTGFTDSVLPYYAQICDQAGLPCYGTKEQFEMLTNKTSYKKFFKEFGVSVIDEYEINGQIADANLDHVKYPVLVKPSDNSGARGISICRNEEQLIEAYNKALEFSKKKEVLVERYIEGEEVTVFYILQDGEIFLSAMGDRHVKYNQDGVIPLPVAYTFPSIYLETYKEHSDYKVKNAFEALGMQNGMVFMQCLVENGECFVYDVGYRLTGTLEYKLLEEISGYNPLEMLINFSLTGNMGENQLKNKTNANWSKYGINISFLSKPGVISNIDGIDEIRNLSNVIDVVIAHGEGKKIPDSAMGTLKQIMLRAFAVANDEKELRYLLDTIYNTLSVTSTTGENMLLEGLELSSWKEGKLV